MSYENINERIKNIKKCTPLSQKSSSSKNRDTSPSFSPVREQEL